MTGQLVDSVIFWAFALLAVGGALVTVFHRSVVYAALSLIVVFMSIAGFFVLNNADFLAIAQVIIYAVGLTIILLFAVMFTGDRQFTSQGKKPVLVAYGIIAAYTLALVWRGVQYGFPDNAPAAGSVLAQAIHRDGSTLMLGNMLFQNYALPFELASILLLIAMVGAIVLAKKRFSDTELDESRDDMRGVKYNVSSDSHVPEEAREAIERAHALEESYLKGEPLPDSPEEKSDKEVAGLPG
ncbi:MAG: NADH-quinone oxidoreductase subunit J [Candidatus Melainabacteria bacterium]